jgi:PKD repeat protein
LSFAIAIPAAAGAGTITGLTVTPAEVKAGASVSATATGSGLCGAVHIDWGDGTAITYATTTLPVTQTHVYQAGGTFTVRAQGMGNCDGEATARVTITSPPPPPPPAPRLGAIEFTPPSPAPRTAVTITLQGTGMCRIGVDFGDGNSQDLNGALPLTVRHTYALAGSYTVVAIPAPACGERQRATLVVGDTPRAPRISNIEVTDVTGVPGARGRRAIKVNGAGSCAYTLDFGDGNSEGRNAALPDVVQHNYPAEGRYTIVATAAPPCEGVQRSTIVIGPELGNRISRMEVVPRTAVPDQPVRVTVRGAGACRFTVDFGDGRSRTMTETLPYEFSYRYREPGDYEMFLWTEPPCEGEATALVRVRRR